MYWQDLLNHESSQAAAALQAVSKMTDRLLFRGPDANGLKHCSGVVLGHLRLAIHDLDARTNQPLMSTDSRFVAVFNCEIYNFQAFWQKLQSRDMVFCPSSDTEVLWALFVRECTDMLTKLRSIFAFVVWDTAEQSLFLALDRHGVKPMFYLDTPSGFAFESQVNGLLVSGFVSAEQSWLSLQAFTFEAVCKFRGRFALMFFR